MRAIRCNNLFYHYVHSNKGSVSIPGDSLHYNFIFTIFGGPARFYHRLAYMLYNILDEGGYFDVLYNILDKDGYLYEDN